VRYWSFWVSGLALSGVMVFHWLTLHRMMAVSGRVTALIDRLRHGSVAPTATMSQEELLAAIQSVTAEEFGPSDALPSAEEPGVSPTDEPTEEQAPAALTQLPAPATRTPLEHFLFFFGLISGGAIAGLLNGGFSPTLSLQGPGFTSLTGGSLVSSTALLAFGGALVGFGTRMSGGCTSGHGLCGLSRLQPGSIVATLAFFGVGILVSFALSVAL
jgi:hypothetical protein